VFVRGDWLKGSAVSVAMLGAYGFLGVAERLTARQQGYYLLDQSDFVAFLPVGLLFAITAAWLASVASAGLFEMALRTSRDAASFRDYITVLRRPWRFLPGAVLIAVSFELATAILLTHLWVVYLTALLVAPLFAMVLPMMVHRRVGLRSAILPAIKLAVRSYPKVAWATWWSSLRSAAGLLLFGVGVIWTLPIYQQSVGKLYCELAGLSENPASE
jgi:hypothetical protein